MHSLLHCHWRTDSLTYRDAQLYLSQLAKSRLRSPNLKFLKRGSICNGCSTTMTARRPFDRQGNSIVPTPHELVQEVTRLAINFISVRSDRKAAQIEHGLLLHGCLLPCHSVFSVVYCRVQLPTMREPNDSSSVAASNKRSRRKMNSQVA